MRSYALIEAIHLVRSHKRTYMHARAGAREGSQNRQDSASTTDKFTAVLQHQLRARTSFPMSVKLEDGVWGSCRLTKEFWMDYLVLLLRYLYRRSLHLYPVAAGACLRFYVFFSELHLCRFWRCMRSAAGLCMFVLELHMCRFWRCMFI